MKIIFILIFGFFCLSDEKICSFLGKIAKKETITITNSYSYVYIDTLEFPHESEIIIATTVYNGYFIRENRLYYGEGDSLPSTIVLNKTEISYMSSSSSVSHNYDWNNQREIYLHYTNYFKIPKPTQRYLYVSMSEFAGSYGEIEISEGFPVWAIIVIIIGGVLIFTAIIIGIIRGIRRSRMNYFPPITPSIINYTPPVSNYPNNPPMNYQRQYIPMKTQSPYTPDNPKPT